MRPCIPLMIAALSIVQIPFGAGADGGEPARLKVVSWNVLYGFNHHQSVDEGVNWICSQKPDVLALQELNGNTQESLDALARRWGHAHAAILKEKGFPVGLTSTAPIEVVERRVEGFHHGYLHARTHGIHFFVVHFWPGKDHEARRVLDRIAPLLAAQEQVIVLGDFNAHSRTDADDLAARSRTPRYQVVDLFEREGFVDLVHKHDPSATYSFSSPITIPTWSKDLAEVESKRQRIDFIFADPQLQGRSRRATIVTSDVVDTLSDHYPVVAEFSLPRGGASPAGAHFSFGLIADCQYCSVPLQGIRHYALSTRKLESCVEHFNTMDLAYVVHLGDFIDRDFNSFDVVGPIYGKLIPPRYHVLGNHDFSVADHRKADVREKLGMPSTYYDFAVKGWRFVVLDGNDISFHAHPKDSDAYRAADEYYVQNGITSPTWNGAIGTGQLTWLKAVLARADAAGENVVLYCHFPVYPENAHNLWNADEVLDVVDAHPSVRAYINGHNHAGNYGRRNGVHYLTIKGMVDTEESAYAVIHVYENRLEVVGHGREGDRTLDTSRLPPGDSRP